MNISLRDARDNTSGNQWRANCYDNQAETTSSDIGVCTVKLPAQLPDGEYYMQIGAQDAAGNWSTVATRNVKIQRAAPVQPANLHAKFQYDSQDTGKYLNVTAKTGGNNLELYWDSPIDWVTGYQVKVTYPNGDNYDLNNEGYQGPNAYAWIQGTFGKHGQGAYIYQVRASNSNGWSVWSDPLTLVYDTQSPKAQFTQVIENNVFVNKNFHVEATVSDSAELKTAGFDVRNASGWQAGCAVNTFKIEYSADHKSATLSCDINTSKLMDGAAYYVRVHAGDYIGYGSKDGAPLSVRNFIIDRTAPSIPTNGQPNGTYLKTNNFDFSWSASTDNASGPLSYEFQSSMNPTIDGNGVLTSGLWQSGSLNGATIHSQGAAFSTWYWQVRAHDAAGNYSAWSPVWDVTLDNVNPSSTNDLAALVKGKITINQTVTDNTAAVSGKLRIWRITNGVADNTKFFAIGDKTVDTNGVVAYDLDTVANLFGDGEYIAKFTSTDKAGNASVAQQNFTVDNTRPAASITTPANNAYEQSGDFTIAGTASDNQTGVDYVNIYVSKVTAPDTNGKTFGGYVVDNQPATTYDVATGVFTYDVNGLADGAYVIKAIAFDHAGNSHFANSVTVVVDHVAPKLTINTSNGTSVTGTTNAASDTVTVDGHTAIVAGTVNQNDTYDWSFTPTIPYKVGTTTVTIISTDTAGNMTQQTADVVVAPADAHQSMTETNAPSGTATLIDATSTPIVQSFAVTPNNDNATITPTDATDTAVLGTQTKKDTSSSSPASDEAVLGTNDAKSSTWTIFGLAWYWWLLILAVAAAIIAWIVAAARRASDSSL